jgi:hypothetical protein
MSCERIPGDVEFGHSCQHGEAPHSIKVLIMKSHNPAAVYRRFARQGGFGGDGMSERDKSPYRRPESIGGYPVDRERQCEANTVKGRGCRNSPVVGGRFCPCHLDPNPRGTPSPKMEAARRVFEKLDEDQLRAFQTGTREFEERMRELIDKQRRSRHADETG